MRNLPKEGPTVLTLVFSTIRAYLVNGYRWWCSNGVHGATQDFPRGQGLEGHLCLLHFPRKGREEGQTTFLEMCFRKLACGEFSQGASGKASRHVDLLLWALGPLSSSFWRSVVPYVLTGSGRPERETVVPAPCLPRVRMGRCCRAGLGLEHLGIHDCFPSVWTVYNPDFVLPRAPFIKKI